MSAESVEVECPVCDRKVPADSNRCPYCHADFTMSGLDELEKVAREINDPAIADAPSVDKVESAPGVDPGPAHGPPVDPSEGDQAGPDNKKDGLLGRFFKKKK